MANEIQVGAVTGLVVSVQMYNGAAVQGSPIATTEVGTTGNYIASIPGGTPYGHYLLIASVVGGDNPVIASGEIFWDGNYENIDSLAKLEGLDPANPMNVTPSSRTSGAIDLDITGDGLTTTTVTRV